MHLLEDLHLGAALTEGDLERKTLFVFEVGIGPNQIVGEWRRAEVQEDLEPIVAAGLADESHEVTSLFTNRRSPARTPASSSPLMCAIRMIRGLSSSSMSSPHP